jgi:hypothetical protein
MAKRYFLSSAALASQQAKRARLAEEAAAAIQIPLGLLADHKLIMFRP